MENSSHENAHVVVVVFVSKRFFLWAVMVGGGEAFLGWCYDGVILCELDVSSMGGWVTIEACVSIRLGWVLC